MKSRQQKKGIAASAALVLSLGFVSGELCALEDDGDGASLTSTRAPLQIEPDTIADPGAEFRRVADRIVNGRTNIELIGDSIMYTDLSAAYLTRFRPKHGFRGYSSPGKLFSIHFWSGYTNAYSGWSDEALAFGDELAVLSTAYFMHADSNSPWVPYSGPANVRSMTALGDLPDNTRIAEMGSANYYERIWADRSFLTEEGAQLRYRVLWYDHPTAMPFSVQGESTVAPESDGSTGLYEVPVQQTTSGLAMRYMEIPEVVTLSDATRDLSRRTGIAIHTASGHVEEPEDAMLVSAVRVWNDARENGIQWGWVAASGASALSFELVAQDAWQTYIEYQQSDTFLIQLGVNDLIHQISTGAETAVVIGQIVEKIHAAHVEARKVDPTIQEPHFLLVSPTDCWNPYEGGLAENTEWVDLAEGLRAFADTREDTVYIDLRGMVEEIEGHWFHWRYTHTRDGLHPKGPYWHANGDIMWECHPYSDGAMFYANLVWGRICDAAPGVHRDDPSDLCNCDIDLDCEIGGSDLAEVLAQWGPAQEGALADFDGNGVVDGLDLAVLLGSWGPCP